MRFLQWILLAVLITNCTGSTEEKSAFFGGHILNPKSKTVYLYKDFKLIDSTKLSNDAKFAFNINATELGLYRFKHGIETQVIYLEPNDSLLMRLNTWDFDESLVFSGKGSERNNFLINLFVESSNEDKAFRKYYKLDESGFQKVVDSIIMGKELLFSQFKEEVGYRSSDFDKLIKTAIYYPLYEKKEMYPFRRMRYNKLDSIPKVSEDFYAFRKDIDLNDKLLAYYYPHNYYVKTYLYHKSWQKEKKDSTPFEVNFMQFALEELKIDAVRNSCLREGIWRSLMNHNLSTIGKEKAQRLFYDHCSDTIFVDKISKLINASEKIKKGSTISNITLSSPENKLIKLLDLTKGKNTVLYTWPTSIHEIKNFAKRINYLEKKYPEYLFVGINSKNYRSEWLKHISGKKINGAHQFMPAQKVSWLEAIEFPIAILIDTENVVQNPMTHLQDKKFEYQLKKLAKPSKIAEIQR